MNLAIILAAGSGVRFSSSTPKQFITVGGKPLFCHSVEAFEKHPEIDKILIVTLERFIQKTQAICEKRGYDKVIDVIAGGSTRQTSSFEAMQYLQYVLSENDTVLIHDAARPLLPQRVISEHLSLAHDYPGVITTLPCTDTICESSDGKALSKNLDRKKLYLAQTPQSFRFGILWKAHQQARDRHRTVTDDAQLLVEQNLPVAMAQGDARLLKVTTQEDLAIIRQWLKEMDKNV